jgi:nucleotide-binding universal stress UspA family protein
MSGIVVGVDGSPASQHALVWAHAEAEQRGTDLDVVMAWAYPYQWAEGFNPEWAADNDYFATSAAAEVGGAIDAMLAGAPRPAWIHTHIVEGAASVVLLRFAQAAELLVVGTRGRGGFTDLLLGSVSTACVHHTPCAITVVPVPGSPKARARQHESAASAPTS